MVALIAVALAPKALLQETTKAKHVIVFAEKERSQWPEDLTSESEWAIGKIIIERLMMGGEESDTNAAYDTIRLSDRERMLDMVECATEYCAAAGMAGFSALSEDHRKQTSDVITAVNSLPHVGEGPESRKFFFGFTQLLAWWLSRHGSSVAMTLEEAWNYSRSMYNVSDYKEVIGDPATPELTKLRRLEWGSTGLGRTAFIRSVNRAMPKFGFAAEENSQTREYMQEIGIDSLFKGDKSQVFLSTCMSRNDYESFLAEKEYKSVWQRGASWHNRFSDQPLAARCKHEMRLFGERGDGITYGYLTTCESWQDDVSRAGRAGYGEVEVFWEPSILKNCTFTFEDSHSAETVFDAYDETLLTFAAFLCSVFHPWQGIRNNCYQRIAAQTMSSDLSHLSGRFLEFQCHQPLTPDNVESVVVHGGGKK